jgi:hypothetical protein
MSIEFLYWLTIEPNDCRQVKEKLVKNENNDFLSSPLAGFPFILSINIAATADITLLKVTFRCIVSYRELWAQA